MRARLTSLYNRVFKSPIVIPAVLVSFAKFFADKKREADKSDDAYEILGTAIKRRSSHYQMNTVFDESRQTRFFGGTPDFTPEKSIEPITHICSTNLGTPVLWARDGSWRELNALSLEQWPEFFESLSDDVFVTFGYRKGMNENFPIFFTHAIVYVHDAEGRHAIFGYAHHLDSSKGNVIFNDSNFKEILPKYTLHDELTIAGDRERVVQLFKRMEFHAQQPFDGISSNCFSPVVSALLEAQSLGFKVPDVFEKSLLIVIPKEQNHFGSGITLNRHLGPLAARAVEETLQVEIPSQRR